MCPTASPKGFTVYGINTGKALLLNRRSVDLFGTFMQVNTLPSGVYWLEVQVNPDHAVYESDYSNNLTRVLVQL
jgi:hypothetical protein